MKLILGLFVSLLAMSLHLSANELLPAEHSAYVNQGINTASDYCGEEFNFYFDENGQCGCLAKEDIFSPNSCAEISCGEGKTRSSLYQYGKREDLVEILYQGCGCFSNKGKAIPAAVAKKKENETLDSTPGRINVPCYTNDLILAIYQANLLSNTNLYLAHDCTYVLYVPETENEGLPLITSQMTFIGQNTVIERHAAADPFRILTVTSGATLSLFQVNISNGKTSGLGGAVQVDGTFSAKNVTFSNNEAANGGAVSVSSEASGTFDDTDFISNTTTSVGGGGLINFGSVNFLNPTFEQNTAPINGAGINTQPGGRTSINFGTFKMNTANGLGGAFSNLGSLSLSNTLVKNNTATAGGGIATGNSNVSLTGSTSIISNSATNCSPQNTINGCTN